MIGLLNTYHFDKTPGCYQEKYIPMFLNYLKKVMPQETIRVYDITQGEFPQKINECTGYIIPGSPASVYDDLPWIQNLIEFTKKLHMNEMKMVGICFGHQLIAHALGGKVSKSDKGWGIGIKKFKIEQKTNWMEVIKSDTVALLFSHQDQVIMLPKNSTRLAGDSFCENQIYSIGEHIYSLQGHPEFTKEYAIERYKTRIDQFEAKTYKTAIESMKDSTNDACIGKSIQIFFTAN